MVEARQTVTPATKLTGDIRVPGELAEATLTLILASLSEGESQVDNTPPGIAPLVSTLGGLGVELQAGVSCVTVRGRGLRSLTAPSAEVDLGGTGVTDTDLRYLHGFSRLRTLTLPNHISPDAIGRLKRQHLPDCQVSTSSPLPADHHEDSEPRR